MIVELYFFLILDCPCDTECPSGCLGCSNLICAECADKENNQNWYQCIEKYGAGLGLCVYYCAYDDNCISDCVFEYQNQIKNCPCEVLYFFLFDWIKSGIQFFYKSYDMTHIP